MCFLSGCDFSEVCSSACLFSMLSCSDACLYSIPAFSVLKHSGVTSDSISARLDQGLKLFDALDDVVDEMINHLMSCFNIIYI